MKLMTVEQKKALVVDRICRVLTSKKDGGDCIVGKEAERIIEGWFRTPNSWFGGRTPQDSLEDDFQGIIDYIEYLNEQFLHEDMREFLSERRR